MPTIEVSEETYRKLEKRAERLHKSVPEVVEPMLDVSDESPQESPRRMSREEWRKRFDAMMDDFRRNPPVYPEDHYVDVSRESIYEGCGE
jgi:hypothetical protein